MLKDLKMRRRRRFPSAGRRRNMGHTLRVRVEFFLWAHGHGNLALPVVLHLELKIPDGIAPCAAVLNKDDLKTKKSEQGAGVNDPSAGAAGA